MRNILLACILAGIAVTLGAFAADAHPYRHPRRHHRQIVRLQPEDQGALYRFFNPDAVDGTFDSVESSGLRNQGQAFRRARELATIVGVRPSLAADVVRWESGGRYTAKARSTSASGPMQVVDKTARSIAGRSISRRERMSDTGIKLGVAYLAACQEALPSANNRAVWRRCYYLGHANVGASIGTAQRAFQALAFR